VLQHLAANGRIHATQATPWWETTFHA
jgi:hypothetical protein